jgi:hypothetical protein
VESERTQPPPQGRPAPAELPWPEGWPSPGAQDAVGWMGALFGSLLLAAAVAGTAEFLADRQFREALLIGLIAGGFGVALILFGSLSFAPLFAPLNRYVPPRLTTVQHGGVNSTGVSLPCSRAWVVRKLASSIAFCASGLGLALVGGGWTAVLAGTTILVLGGAVGVVRPLRLRAGRGWQLVLLPRGVLYQEGPVRTFVPWDHVVEVRAYQRRSSRQLYGPPGLGLLVDDQAVIDTTAGPLGRLLLRDWNRGVDVSYPVEVLAVDPALVYAALCYYTAHPQARAELGDHRGLQRLLRHDLA